MVRHFILLISLLTVALTALAVPARRDLRTITQPDGSKIKVRLVGDETFHYWQSEDGNPLDLVDGFFKPLRADSLNARMQAAKKRAFNRRLSISSPLTRGEGSIPGKCEGYDFPTVGKQKGLVILVDFADIRMTTENPGDYFNRQYNEPGFSDNGATGSARDWFIDASSGQFSPDFDVIGPVQLPNGYAYYGKNDIYGTDKRALEMIIHACQAADDIVDFSEYDRDGNGQIDCVFVLYAGEGEASSSDADTVWPHSWQLSQSGEPEKYVFDGKELEYYACSNEIFDGEPDTIGTFVHEFSHVMGLPDLYATDSSRVFSPGEWSVMAYGTYNNYGRTPPTYSAFERAALGWLTPFEMDTPADVTLPPIQENKAGIIRTPLENEFFLVENRQQTGWDSYLPHHGMLVWHIDYDSDIWTGNEVNNQRRHQRVDIVEADNSQSDYSIAGDPFPGTANVTAFTPDTKPALRTWDNKPVDAPITDIAESDDGIITFRLMGGNAGVDDILVNPYASWAYADGVLTIRDIAPATTVSVFDITGRPLVRTTAGSDGSATMKINADGVAVVKAGASTFKIIL